MPGNHELWSHGTDSYELFTRILPEKIQSMGWRWLQDEPFVTNDIAIVGSLGWYDYSFAQADLGIPRRFYEAKISPGAAERFEEYAGLFNPSDDIGEKSRTSLPAGTTASSFRFIARTSSFWMSCSPRSDRSLTRCTIIRV